MLSPNQTLVIATGRYDSVRDDWIPATALRSLGPGGDPCQVWFKYWGAAHGFQQDPKKYSFLNWIGEKGRAFEDAWVKNVCPEAVQALDKDVDVRQVQGLRKTLELMARRVPVITKASLWWAPERVYGSSDVICLTSWLYKRFPHLKPPGDDQPDTYVVIDAKFSTGLDESDKKTDLAGYEIQTRIYSFILGHLQGYMPKYAYLVTRDRVFDPLPILVNQRLNEPLDSEISKLRDLFLHIKKDGGKYLPWRDAIVAPNWSNSHTEPWSGAKKRIARDFLPDRPMEWLPQVGRTQVTALGALGFSSLKDVLALPPEALDWESLPGIGATAAARIRAVLQANRSGKASAIPQALLPRRVQQEYYVDMEFLGNINCDFQGDWPALAGREMLFMLGLGWEENGQFYYRQFVAGAESHEAERTMVDEFLAFLEKQGALRPNADAVFYHWSHAEVHQSKSAAERHCLPQFANLPWYDLQGPAHAIPLGLNGCWNFGLKSVATAVGKASPEHEVKWPTALGDGLSASVMGWKMYESPQPLLTKEAQTLAQYLEIDVKAMWATLKWMRSVAVPGQQTQKREIRESFWYRAGRIAASNSGVFWNTAEQRSVTL